MNTLVNLVLSFVVFMVSVIIRFALAFKLPLGFGLVVYLLLSGIASAEAAEIVTQCGAYGKLTLEQCEELTSHTTEKFLVFVGGLILLISALAVFRQEQRKRLEEIEERNKFFE